MTKNAMPKRKKITLIVALTVVLCLGITFLVGSLVDYWYLEIYILGRRIGYDIQTKKCETGHVVFVGDSITDSCDLATYYPGLNAYNRGIAGDVSEGVLRRMDNSIFDLQPSLVVLLIGTNDYQRCPTHSNQHILQNYRQILQQIHDKAPQTKVLVQSVYPIANVKYPKHYRYGHDAVVELNAALADMAAEYGYAFANVYPLLADENGNMIMAYSKDGLHPNHQGYLIISEYLRPIIDTMLAQ